MNLELSQSTILIVDDSPENINILGELLRGEYTVRVANNGEKAIKIASSDAPPDLILLDIIMPGLDGYEVCRILKSDECTRNIPVIFITGKSREQDEVMGFEAGAVDYITKPFSPIIVKARVRTHLELKRHRELLESLSYRDGLTCIPNRRRFDDYLPIAWNYCSRDFSPISLAMFDIDRFKEFNDHYGHLNGDSCLVEVAQCLAGTVRRKVDLLARYGGEEFACVLPRTPLEDACKFVELMRSRVYDLAIPHAYSGIEPCVTISIGLTCMIPYQGGDCQELIRQADLALYEAKQQGRNRVCAFPCS